MYENVIPLLTSGKTHKKHNSLYMYAREKALLIQQQPANRQDKCPKITKEIKIKSSS